MKINRGIFKKKQIKLEKSKYLRPTRSFIKEAMFNILLNYFDFKDKVILDLCAGSGQLGFESLSLGANKVIFIDHDLNLVKKNLKNFNIDTNRFQLIQKNIFQIKDLPKFDLCFFDPPYDNLKLYEHGMKILFKNLNSFVCIEMSKNLKIKEKPFINRVYGNSRILIFNRQFQGNSYNL